MENVFGSNDVYNFLKLLIEIGDVHYVDSNHCVYRTEDKTPVGCRVGTGKGSTKQIALFKEGERPPANTVYLNPFVELMGTHPELDLFMTVISIVPGCMVLKSMINMAELITSKNNDMPYKTAEMLSKYVGKVDAKFINELQKIGPMDAGFIFYDPKKYVAQLQCSFWDTEFETKMKSKLRKSSLALIRSMAEDLYKTKTPHEVSHAGTLPPCKKFDAVSHVLIETLDRINDIVSAVTGFDLHVPELKEHLERLPAYHKAMQWLASSTASRGDTEKTVSRDQIPFNIDAVSSPLAAAVPVSDKSGFLASAEPVGVTRNPNFHGSAGVTKNPTFGIGNFGAATFGAVAPVVPITPGLGAVEPVRPGLSITEMSNITRDAYNTCAFGSGFANGFLG